MSQPLSENPLSKNIPGENSAGENVASENVTGETSRALPAEKPGDGRAQSFPRPTIKKMRWPYPLIWLVPLAAAIALGVYLYDHSKNQGPTIKVTFNDVDGLKADETVAQYRGVEIGKVTSVRLSDDHRHAIVELRLRRPDESIARTGALFWIVRPEISTANIAGLGTLVTGPYIQVIPGGGTAASDFTGLEKAPLMPEEDGVWLVLHMDHLEQLQGDSPIFYRGIRVGTVQEVQLAHDASQVDVHAVIRQRYSALVRAGSQFWKMGGADVKGGVLTGLEVKVNSLQSLLSGGIAFATPEKNAGDAAKDGDQFVIHDDAKKEWLDWSPKITIDPIADGGSEKKDQAHPVKGALKSAMGEK